MSYLKSNDFQFDSLHVGRLSKLQEFENQTFIQKLEIQHQENFDRTKNNIPLEIENITFPVYLSFQRNIFLIQLKFFLKLANMTKLSPWFLSNSQPLKYRSHKLIYRKWE